MKNYLLIGLAALVALGTVGAQERVNKATEVYAVKGADTLRLDRYWVAGATEPATCIVFMFGGGFHSGMRDRAEYIPYFEYMAREGFQVVSIDYRLGFQGMVWPTEGKKPSARELIDFFEHDVVDVAVEDFFDATAYVVAQADAWGVDPGRIVGNGSSAGAVSVLQGAYYETNGHEMAARLPENFSYAGMISFAGAIFATGGGLKWQAAPCPLLLIHGDADANVPYNKMSIFGTGLYGPKKIAKKLDKLNAPYWFYSVENVDHELATTPMDDNREEILSFIRHYVEEGQPLVIRTEVDPTDKPDVKKRFGMKAYIRKNFTGE